MNLRLALVEENQIVAERNRGRKKKRGLELHVDWVVCCCFVVVAAFLLCLRWGSSLLLFAPSLLGVLNIYNYLKKTIFNYNTAYEMMIY